MPHLLSALHFLIGVERLPGRDVLPEPVCGHGLPATGSRPATSPQKRSNRARRGPGRIGCADRPGRRHLRNVARLRTIVAPCQGERRQDKAIEQGGDKDGTILEHYGDIEYKFGEKDKAVDYWIKARDKGNNSDLLDRKIRDKKWYEK